MHNHDGTGKFIVRKVSRARDFPSCVCDGKEPTRLVTRARNCGLKPSAKVCRVVRGAGGQARAVCASARRHPLRPGPGLGPVGPGHGGGGPWRAERGLRS